LREDSFLLREAMSATSSAMNGIETPQTALQLKELGNADFKAGHFDKAIEHYSRAIGMPRMSEHGGP
jgi:hypothetical protein